MATTYKILGRGTGGPAPAATAYTVPAGKCAVISTFSLSNNSSGSNTFSVYITDTAGTAGATSNQILSGVTLAGNSRAAFTWGITLTAGQTFKVNGGTSCTLIVFGSEIDV